MKTNLRQTQASHLMPDHIQVIPKSADFRYGSKTAT